MLVKYLYLSIVVRTTRLEVGSAMKIYDSMKNLASSTTGGGATKLLFLFFQRNVPVLRLSQSLKFSLLTKRKLKMSQLF